MSFLIEKYAFRDGICEIVQTVLDRQPRIAKVRGPCYSCGKPQTVSARPEELEKFRAGGYAQDCFPTLPADQREFLISGICGVCWDEMFGGDEEDE